MFRHNLLIIYRSFKRFKSTFIINLLGLSTGLASALLIYLWVDSELHMDKFHENDNRLYNVMDSHMQNDGWNTMIETSGAAADALAAEMPEVGEDKVKHALDQFGHRILKDRGIGEHISQFIEKRTGIETRFSVIGHMQRGGAPTLFDRMLATRVGMKAADLVHAGQFGMMSALVGNKIMGVPLENATGELKTVSKEWFDMMEVLF